MRFGVREFIFILVLMAVPVASFFLVFKPQNERINLARQEIHVKQSRMDRLAAITDRLEDLDLAIANGRESIELIEQKLPDEEGVDDILQRVWQIAKRNRQTVKSVKSKKKLPAVLYMELPLEMVMEGDFDGFYQFLLELENLQRITRIHDLDIQRMDHKRTSSDDETMAGMARAEFTLSIYFETSATAMAGQ